VVVGVLVVEAAMGLDGLGQALFEAIRSQDRNVVVSLVMLITIVVILMNLVADLLVAALDPRARTGLLEETA
jgi:ABC-type dipeptide/oligopeptide/nickel transport system permease component